MNVNSLIIDTLSPLGYPVEFGNYEGKETIYFVFNYADDRAIDYADDTPQNDVASMQIHLFAPKTFNHMNLKKQARSLLFEAGFSYPQITTLYEDDTKVFHIIFECEIEENSETEV